MLQNSCNLSPAEQRSLENAVEMAAANLKQKPPGFFAVQVCQNLTQNDLTCSSAMYHTIDHSKMIPQAIGRARSQASDGHLLKANESIGPYGEAFWTRVATLMRPRTAAECIDAYLVMHRNTVARFSASGSKLQT
jgi:hypothetical protein